MSELALKLIAENKAAHARGEDATYLDLGRCGLTELPKELEEVPWVESLVLSNGWWKCDVEQREWKSYKSKNNGELNSLVSINGLKKLKSLKRLIITGLGLSDITQIENLTQLTELYCDNNQISNLKPVQNLTQLTAFYCDNNQINDLKPLQNLTQLKELRYENNQISDLKPVQNLAQLKEFYCENNRISDLKPIQNLTQLTEFYCSNNRISDLMPIQNLMQLKELYCSNNRISDLNPIQNLTQLEELRCKNNQISDLKPVQNLTQLKELRCENNQISDLKPVQNLTQLTTLYCGDNQINDLKPVQNLTQLTTLSCGDNQITDLSPILPLIKNELEVRWDSNHFSNSGIFIKDCPLICPPVEFAIKGHDAVLEYFEQLGDERDPLNEIKVIVLGEGASGKTSLIKRIRNEAFDAKESQTHGIRIRKTDFEVADETISAHIWDFGGQEVMHATHQFFLSRRCIYVLVLNSRTDEKAEYWLKHANSFGGDSPVLVVLNKMDENPGYEVNRKQLLSKYPQIKDFFKVSCKDGHHKGVQEFKSALEGLVAQSATRRTPFPKDWRKVKDHFYEMKEDYIQSADYKRICEDYGVDKAFSQDVLLQFLHDLGVVINFRNLKNFDTQILNPLWLTNGVYRIINSPIVAANKGLMHEDELNSVINDPHFKKGNTTDRVFKYPKNKLEYIARVMEEFELCSRINPHTYVVPQLLPVDEPDFQFEGTVLRFIVDFPDFLPDSVFPRLMVKLNDYIKDDLRWRSGMVLYKPMIFNAQARIRADREDKKISIDLCGEEPRRFLSFIRETIKEIVADFTKLTYDELVPVPDTKDEFLEYAYLTEAETAGEKEVFSRQLKKRIPIADLLDGIEEPIMRKEINQIPVRAFIAFAAEDQPYLKPLRNALKPLERLEHLQVWDERDIDPGKERKETYFRELENADIVLCLISADFIASDFYDSEGLKQAMQLQSSGTQKVIPVRLRECAWEKLPLAKLQHTPISNWVTNADNRDQLWTEMVKHIEPLVEKIKARKLAASEKEK